MQHGSSVADPACFPIGSDETGKRFEGQSEPLSFDSSATVPLNLKVPVTFSQTPRNEN